MKRDMKVILYILEYVEQHGPNVPVAQMSIGRGDDGGDNIRYHARLCRDVGWIRSVDSEELGREGPVVITKLTWAGHDELERLRPKPSRYEDPDATLGHV